MWYRFTADNRETLFGWTSNPAVAQAAADWLYDQDIAAGRESGFYGAECLGEFGFDEETAALCGRLEREQSQTLFVTDDTTVEEIGAWADEDT